MNIEQQLEDTLRRKFLGEEEARGLRSDDDLFELLDSVEFIRLIAHLERAYGFDVEDHDMRWENLGTVRNLAEFVGRRSGSGS